MSFRKIFGFLAIAGLFLIAAPNRPAHAISLLNPAAAALVQSNETASPSEIRWRRYGYRRYYAPRRYYRRYYAPRRYYRRRYYRFF